MFARTFTITLAGVSLVAIAAFLHAFGLGSRTSGALDRHEVVGVRAVHPVLPAHEYLRDVATGLYAFPAP